MRRRMLQGLLLALLFLQGCTAVPSPQEAMDPVLSHPDPDGGQLGVPLASPAVQPVLRWHLPVEGQPHRLWWGDELLLVGGLESGSPSGDRFLQAVDTTGALRWQRSLAPSWLVDAAVDAQSVAHLLVAEGAGQGSLLNIDAAGVEQLRLPWREGWPRSIRVGGDGRCLAIGFDGQNGAFMGRLRLLAPDGSPLFPDQKDQLTGFVGFPSDDCSRVLMGYEGGTTGLYPNDLYRGSGLRLLDASGQALWSLINYHRPLALSADGAVAVALGVPSPDRAYQPPQWDEEPAPPYGQILWLGDGGKILDRYRLPYPAQVDAFQMTRDARESLLLLTSHQFSVGDGPEIFRRLVWLSRQSGPLEVRWERVIESGRLADLQLSADGSALLVAVENEVSLLDRQGRSLWEYQHSAPVVAARLSRDGRQVAILAEDGLWFFDARVDDPH